jgi:hypothetical protein
MKLFKLIYLPIVILLFFVNFILLKPQEQEQINFFTSNNDFNNYLQHALSLAKIDTFQLTFRDYLDEVEFYIKSQDKPVKIILSTQKNPYSQISTLQQVIKKDKMKIPQIIDLSSDKQYATF